MMVSRLSNMRLFPQSYGLRVIFSIRGRELADGRATSWSPSTPRGQGGGWEPNSSQLAQIVRLYRRKVQRSCLNRPQSRILPPFCGKTGDFYYAAVKKLLNTQLQTFKTTCEFFALRMATGEIATAVGTLRIPPCYASRHAKKHNSGFPQNPSIRYSRACAQANV